jgi:hypothetical protein
VDVGARCGLECHVGGGFGLGKGEGRGERRRVPFEHKLAHLLIDELGDKLLDQGEVVVDFFAWIRTVVEVSEAGMSSSHILEIMRFLRHPFYGIHRAKGHQPGGASALVQRGSNCSDWGLLLNGRKDLSKCGGANNYRSGGGCSSWKDYRRCIRGTSSLRITSGGGCNPVPLSVGGGVHTE